MQDWRIGYYYTLQAAMDIAFGDVTPGSGSSVRSLRSPYLRRPCRHPAPYSILTLGAIKSAPKGTEYCDHRSRSSVVCLVVSAGMVA